MTHPVAHFLSAHFPDLEGPKYQSALEIISFVTVTAMMIGALVAALTLVAFEL